MSTVAERWMMKGYQEDFEEGFGKVYIEFFKAYYEIGLKLGELQNMKKSIIILLRFRFKRVPKTIQKQINDQDDMTVLEALFKTAVTAQSLKEFAEEL